MANQTVRPGLIAAARVLDTIQDVIAGIGKISCWLILGIIATVLLSVLAGVLGINQFLSWDGELFLFSDAITLNSLLELQWYMFGVMLMLTGAYALRDNRHVRVDVVASRFSPTTARVVEILGDLIFLLPLCIILIDRSLPLLELSYRTGERSNEDGLTHRWVIKMFVPIGFALLTVLGVTRVLRNILVLMGVPDRAPTPGAARPEGAAHGG